MSRFVCFFIFLAQLRMEYRLSQRFTTRPQPMSDFFEGIRAVLVEKDRLQTLGQCWKEKRLEKLELFVNYSLYIIYKNMCLYIYIWWVLTCALYIRAHVRISIDILSQYIRHPRKWNPSWEALQEITPEKAGRFCIARLGWKTHLSWFIHVGTLIPLDVSSMVFLGIFLSKSSGTEEIDAPLNFFPC